MWEFHVKPTARKTFERVYGPRGAWVQLFKCSNDYVRTELIRDLRARYRYITIDVWKSRHICLAFKKKFSKEFDALDTECSKLTTRERFLGEFTLVRPSG